MTITDIQDVRCFGCHTETGGGIPIVIIWFGNFEIAWTWRSSYETLPKGRMHGIGLVHTKNDNGRIVPSFIEVDDDLFVRWRKIKWEPHEMVCDNNGIHFRRGHARVD